MALVRALNSAISGLRAFQLRTDVIGDNLANVNTTAFKTGRVQFQTLLSQTIAFGSAPSGFLGGIDPKQFGLGVAIGDTNKNFAQGSLLATGVASDLAIEGDGFFIQNDQTGGPVYTRDGSFSINPKNLLHNPSTGFIVQGFRADFTTFEIQAGGPLQDVLIPIGDLRIAHDTDNAIFDGNLNGGGDIASAASVLDSDQFRSVNALGVDTGVATLDTLLTDLGRRVNGITVDLALTADNVISLQAQKGNRTLPESQFKISSTPPSESEGIDDFGTTLEDLIDFMEDSLGINTVGSATSSAADDLYSSPIISASFEDGGGVGGDTLDTAAGTYTIGALNLAAIGGGVGFLDAGVEVGDYMRWTTGQSSGQIVRITAVTPNMLTFDPNNTFDPAIPAPTSGDAAVVGDGDRWEIQKQSRVALGNDASGTAPFNNAYPDPARQRKYNNVALEGILRIDGNVGTANGITNLELSKSGGDRLTVFTTVGNAIGESVISNATVYDTLGQAHVVEITYELESKSSLDLQRGDRWRWFAEAVDSDGPDRVVGTGFIQFDTAGQYVSENPLASIKINLGGLTNNAGAIVVVGPPSGAVTPLTITPDHSKVTGFANRASEVALIDQDGFAQGTLTDFSVGVDGIVTGIFSNGQTKELAQLAMARFQNNNGLTAEGDNLFRVGANSGIAIVGTPGTFARGVIHGGFLEESNVDLARQFTDLIVAQRAFQANARTITTSNQMLQDLLNI